MDDIIALYEKYIEKRNQRRMELEEKRKEKFEKIKTNGEESD